MTHLILSLGVLIWTVPIHAINLDWPVEKINLFEFEGAKEGTRAHRFFHSCENLNFSEPQKKSFHEIRTLFLGETRQLRKRIYQLKKQFNGELKSRDSRESQTQAPARQLRSLQVELTTHRQAYLQALFYEIATPEQRSALFRCFNHLNHHREVQRLRKQEKKHKAFHKKHPPKG